MLAVLDTNHFRVVAEGGIGAAKIADRAVIEGVEISLTIITVQEACGGWLGLINGLKAGQHRIRAYASFQRTVAAFRKFRILAFDELSGERFQTLRGIRPRSGTMDLKIAAICLACDATLLPRNLVDFDGIAGLRVENWLD